MAQVSESSGLSTRTISRLIKKGAIRPEITRSKQGTREYRFDKVDEMTLKYIIQKQVVSSNVCYLCGQETGYNNEELKEAVKIMLDSILDAWLDNQALSAYQKIIVQN